MVKNLLDVEPEDPLTTTLLSDFLTFMKGFISIPISFPGSAYAKAVKVLLPMQRNKKRRKNKM